MERAGLITQGKKAQYRPCTIDVTPLEEITRWTEQYRHIWEARFDRMDDYINQLNNKEMSLLKKGPIGLKTRFLARYHASHSTVETGFFQCSQEIHNE